MEVLIILILIIIGAGASSTSSSSSSSKGRKAQTVIYNQQQQPSSQQQPTVVYQPAPQASQPEAPQQAAPAQPVAPQQQQPAPAVQQKAKNSSIRNFAVKSYDKIVKDNQKGKGDHLNSLILLLESEGIPKDESTLLIKKAIRKANGNAEVFADEIENSL